MKCSAWVAVDYQEPIKPWSLDLDDSNPIASNVTRLCTDRAYTDLGLVDNYRFGTSVFKPGCWLLTDWWGH